MELSANFASCYRILGTYFRTEYILTSRVPHWVFYVIRSGDIVHKIYAQVHARLAVKYLTQCIMLISQLKRLGEERTLINIMRVEVKCL